jgi:hypothetical protein
VVLHPVRVEILGAALGHPSSTLLGGVDCAFGSCGKARRRWCVREGEEDEVRPRRAVSVVLVTDTFDTRSRPWFKEMEA